MVIRLILAIFVSGASGVCYLAGLVRLMSALLVAFGSLSAVFFGILFVVPESSRELWFPVYGGGHAWPFFSLALVLAAISALIVTSRREEVAAERVSSLHFQFLIGGFLAYLLNVFIASYFWFPSDVRRLEVDESTLGLYVFGGTCLYLGGTIISLYLFYKASKGGTGAHPDLMRRLVLTVFSVVHFDKFPALMAFLLIYSPETKVIYPAPAALALACYIPVALFLLKLSWQSEKALP